MTLCEKCIHSDICVTRDCMDADDEIALVKCKCFRNKADFVEVVRCKDCKHYKDKGVLNEFDKPLGVCKKDVYFWDDEPIEVLFDDFCSYGERKDA